MRHTGISKKETSEKIVTAVGKGFRKHGYAGIGVDGLAKIAGVTSGAFYSHLGSKDKAFLLALEKGLEEVIETIPNIQNKNKANWVNYFAEYYLGKSHREDLECGCAMASLTTEVIRFPTEVHKLFEKKMNIIIELLASGLQGSSEDICKSRAWSLVAVLTGGLNIVRAVNSKKVSEEISKSIISSAINIAGKTRSKGYNNL
jgi:AcrR family transcriptional regulator